MFCVYVVKPVYGMYGYDNHTTPERSDPNQPLFIRLHSFPNQWATPHHMHKWKLQSELSSVTHGYFGPITSRAQVLR